MLDTEQTHTDQPLRLLTIAQIHERHPGFSIPSIRTLVARARENGLAPHVYRVGRRLMINEPGFDQWLADQAESARKDREARGLAA